jgi:hypothetical protein
LTTANERSRRVIQIVELGVTIRALVIFALDYSE